MLERMSAGDCPAKPHTAHQPGGSLAYEHCLTREGFEGPFTIQYHRAPPQATSVARTERRLPVFEAAPLAAHEQGRKHFPASPQSVPQGDVHSARLPLLFNDDVSLSRVCPTQSASEYFSNADADTLLFVRSGSGTLTSGFGHLSFGSGDYVFIPKGVVHRFELSADPQDWLEMELPSGFGLPSGTQNAAGQLRMDAPYSHRDFRRATFAGPIDSGIRTVLVKKQGQLASLQYAHSPLDVIGYDGCVYPFVFPIGLFQPKVASVHLPPTSHACFSATGVLVCNFVPRPLDFHQAAVPCPYPHSSTDVDEVLFYAEGAFTSRRGVAASSISFHPRGLPHGPHPGRYESSIGQTQTQELAVMLDCFRPLNVTRAGLATEDVAYDKSFIDAG